MTDVTTNQPIRVREHPETAPYIMLPYSQMPDLKQVLDRHGFRYWTDGSVVSIDGKPGVVAVNLARGTSADAVRAALEAVP